MGTGKLNTRGMGWVGNSLEELTYHAGGVGEVVEILLIALRTFAPIATAHL